MIVLHKDGSYQLCDEFSYLHLLDAGWSYSKDRPVTPPKPLTDPVEVPDPALEPEKESEPEAKATQGDLIRMEAKAAGIKSWHLKAIKTLKKELKNVGNQK